MILNSSPTYSEYSRMPLACIDFMHFTTMAKKLANDYLANEQTVASIASYIELLILL